MMRRLSVLWHRAPARLAVWASEPVEADAGSDASDSCRFSLVGPRESKRVAIRFRARAVLRNLLTTRRLFAAAVGREPRPQAGGENECNLELSKRDAGHPRAQPRWSLRREDGYCRTLE